jgi:hypothetical protein
LYLEAISYKLGLNFIYDLQSIGVVPTDISMDFYWVNSAGYGFAPGVHTKRRFISFAAARSFFNSTYPTYITSDMAGSSVGVEYVAGTLQIFNFEATIRIIDILNGFTVNYSFPADVQRTAEIDRSIDFHRQSVTSLINSYKSEYNPFVTLFPTIYAFIYSDPGYFNLTELLEARRQTIMNKSI